MVRVRVTVRVRVRVRVKVMVRARVRWRRLTVWLSDPLLGCGPRLLSEVS
jgi:hypothetical protein